MIRFSAALVAVALGVLAAGVTTSRLLLIYFAIGCSALAFVCLGIGVVVKRGELFGESSRAAGRFDRGPVPAGFGADGFSPADLASAAFGEQPRGARSAAPGQMPRHAFGQSGPAPDARVRVPAGGGRPPADRQEQDWQEPPRATDRRGADVRGSDSRAAGNWQPDARGAGVKDRMSPPPRAARPPAPSPSGTQPGGQPPAGPQPGSQPPADMRPPGGPSAARPQRPAPFPGESQPATPPFGSPQGPDAARQRQEAPGPSRPEPPRGEPSRPPAQEREVPRPQAPGPERPAAFLGGAPRPSGPPRPEDIPPPVAPIYPAGKTPAGSGGEPSQQPPAQPEKAPEPAGPLGWFAAREHAREEPAATRPADDKPPAGDRPPAAAGESSPSTEPVAAAAAEPGPAQDAGSGDAPVVVSPGSGDGSAADREVTIVPGVPRYHRPGCILIRFMEDGDLERRSLTSAAETGYEPCGACQPDAEAGGGDDAADDADDQAPVGG